MATKLERDEKLQESLYNLDKEMDNYSFDYFDIAPEQRHEIRNLYSYFKSLQNNKLFIENLTSGNIRVNKMVNYNGKTLLQDVDHKSTLYFINCKEVTIFIYSKVANITLENCEKVNLKIIGGSIYGIHIINCKNISNVFNDNNIFFIDIDKCIDCKYYISENIAAKTLIQTTKSLNLSFNILNNRGIVVNEYKQNNSYFDLILKRFRFDKINNNFLMNDISNEFYQQLALRKY